MTRSRSLLIAGPTIGMALLLAGCGSPAIQSTAAASTSRVATVTSPAATAVPAATPMPAPATARTTGRAPTPTRVAFTQAQLIEVAKATYHGGDHYVAVPGDCGYVAVGGPETAQFDTCPWTAAFRARAIAKVKSLLASGGVEYSILCACQNTLGNLTYTATPTATGGTVTVTGAYSLTYTVTIVSVAGQALVDGITLSHPASPAEGPACTTDLIDLTCT